MNGSDPFGAPTIVRSWMNRSDSIQAAKKRRMLPSIFSACWICPFFTFHDRDIAPEGASLRDSLRNFHEIADYIAIKTSSSKARLLWGTANLFRYPRFMSGAATNPDPEVFAYSAAIVKHCMDVTKALSGDNYVLWAVARDRNGD